MAAIYLRNPQHPLTLDKTLVIIQAVQLVTAHQGPVGPKGLVLLEQPELKNILTASVA